MNASGCMSSRTLWFVEGTLGASKQSATIRDPQPDLPLTLIHTSLKVYPLHLETPCDRLRLHCTVAPTLEAGRVLLLQTLLTSHARTPSRPQSISSCPGILLDL